MDWIDVILYIICLFQNSKEPKATIPLSELNICLAPVKMNQDNGLQLSYMCDGSTRHMYVYHESGEMIIHWYMAIRNMKLNWLMVAYPSVSAEEVSVFVCEVYECVSKLCGKMSIYSQVCKIFYTVWYDFSYTERG